jgi:probable HAF family extracellular repeat protein
VEFAFAARTLWREAAFENEPAGSAFGINDHGQAVGHSTTASGDFHAILWQVGKH